MTASDPAGHTIAVDVWSDIMCPFCYMGDTLLAQAVEKSDHEVAVRYHSYQLMPDLPVGSAAGVDELLEQQKGIPRAQAESMNAQVSARAADIGLEYRLDRAVATNTKAAHRLTHLAKARDLQHEMMRRLFRAYFTEGAYLGDHGVLADLAAEVGIERAGAYTSLENEDFDGDVDADAEQARRLGISGVPFFVFDERYAVSGAQSVETFGAALEKAAADTHSRRA